MKVCLDTNVLASALATRGLCADVLRLVLASHTLLVPPVALAELRRVLCDKFGTPSTLVAEALGSLAEHVTKEGIANFETSLAERSDAAIIGAALAAGAGVLVTGDKEMQSLGSVRSMAILSPRQFWERTKARRGPTS